MKKIITAILLILVITQTTSGISEGDLLLETTFNIEPNGYESKVLELPSDFPLNTSLDGFRGTYQPTNISNLDLVYSNNESFVIYENASVYEGMNILIGENFTFAPDKEFNILYDHFAYVNTSLDDPYKFLLIIYNNNPFAIELTIQLFYSIQSNVFDDQNPTNKETLIFQIFGILALIIMPIMRKLRTS